MLEDYFNYQFSVVDLLINCSKQSKKLTESGISGIGNIKQLNESNFLSV
jgi:hypothetical protein